MAKSKSGGARGFLRGRIGSDVYSIGKTAKGQRQQVVRSLAEQVANPRTQSQMFGRMIMSTVMQAVSGLSFIIDHSFDGVAVGQPSISEFIRENYALAKADAIAHPASGNMFGLKKYGERGISSGKWLISKGKLQKPWGLSSLDGTAFISVGENPTVGSLKQNFELSADGYATFVVIHKTDGVKYARVKIDTNLSDDTAITASNVGNLFAIESNVDVTPTLDGTSITFTLTSSTNCAGETIIVSDKVDGKYQHNTAKFESVSAPDFAADVALPTYPVGSEQFLNGGEV